MIAVNIGCKSVRRRSLELLILLTAVVLQGCSFTGTTHDARVDAFERDMRTVEIGPMSFPNMSSSEVVSELCRVGNEALVKVESPYGFSMRCHARKCSMDYRQDWNIPQMPILQAFEYVCGVCGASMKFENGVILIYSKEDEDVLFKSSKEGEKKDEAENEPSEEECKRRDELMRTLEIGPVDLTDMTAYEAGDELFSIGNDALEQAGSACGCVLGICYDGRAKVIKRDWHIPRMTILQAYEYLCRLCCAKIGYGNGFVTIDFADDDGNKSADVDGEKECNSEND